MRGPARSGLGDRLGDAGKIAALAAVYAVVARLGLMLDAVAGFATLVWPPTGISLAVLLRFGPRLWPGVAIGAFVANVLTGAPPTVALGIATGNTIEALVGAHLLRRVPGFRGSFDRLRDVLALIVYAAIFSTTLSATVGVTSLCLGKIVGLPLFGETWRAWWIGDLIADLVVTPALLVWWTARSPPAPSRRRLETMALAWAVGAASVLIYQSPAATDEGASILRQSYVFFPFLTWAALRLGQRETITTTFAVVAISVAGTALGRGPFVQASLHQNLLSLQIFMAVSAATFLVLAASIAERRHAATELAAAHQALENKVEEVRKLLLDLEEAVRARDALISIAAHELRTPLTALQLQVHMLERNLAKSAADGPSIDALRSRLAGVDRPVARLARLIENLLDVARITAGRLQLEYEELDLVSPVRDVVSRFEDELRRTEQAVSVRADAPVVGMWDRMRIEQIVTNLVSNAVKYGEDRPVEIIVEGDENSGRIVVRDHGIGIAESDQARIFERFERAVAGRHAGGFGLGLWIVREIVQALGGTIAVRSKLGAGTTFTVELPKKHEQVGLSK